MMDSVSSVSSPSSPSSARVNTTAELSSSQPRRQPSPAAQQPGREPGAPDSVAVEISAAARELAAGSPGGLPPAARVVPPAEAGDPLAASETAAPSSQARQALQMFSDNAASGRQNPSPLRASA
ncbi:MAG: hypothetical protein V5B32_01410 [Candidatus Accumulibacter sp. UW26]|jgi:hypothetical protein